MSTAPLEHLIRVSGALAGDDVLLDHFVTRRDDAAFEALLRRHGPRVFAVCRRVLPPDDADDAFQATFLHLLRQAATIRDRHNLRGWLLTVAHRVAMEALRRSRRRREAEAVEPATVPADPSWREACTILHEEVDRLPERFRLPLVLCYFEGFSRDEAAAQLGWSTGMVKGRLERGRWALKARLTRRGIALSAGALLFAGREAAGAVPEALLQLALNLGAGASMKPPIAALLLAPHFAGLRRVALILGLMLVAGIGAITRGRPTPDDAKATPRDAPAAKPADTTTIRGKVVGPDGKTFAGAKLSLDGEKDLGVSAADGTFAVQAPAEILNGRGIWALLASAKGYAPGWVHLPTESEDITLRLAKDDVPIQGRIVDLQGQPLAGVKVEIAMLVADNIGELLGLVRPPPPNPGDDIRKQLERHISLKPSVVGRMASATTDAEGRFRLDGVGRDRYVGLRLKGSTIRQTLVQVTTMEPLPPLPSGRPRRSPLPATFEFSVAPGRILRGVVREKGTGLPIAGARVLYEESMQSTTDAQGRYEITGLPKKAKIEVHVCAPPETHFSTSTEVADQPGLGPLEANFELLRGISVHGRVIDAATKKPIKAMLLYRALGPNPYIRSAPGGDRVNGFFTARVRPKYDGSFTVAVLPGPGAIFIMAEGGGYAGAFVDPAQFFGVELKNGMTPYGNSENLVLALGGAATTSDQQEAYQAIVLLNPPADAKEIAQDVVLTPARPVHVEVVDANGKPVPDLKVRGLTYRHSNWQPQKKSEFDVHGLNPERLRVLEFRNDAAKLVGHVELRPGMKQPVRVALEPWATVTGRLLDPDGQPMADMMLHSPGAEVNGQTTHGSLDLGTVQTDADGRFRVEGLTPGVDYKFYYRSLRPPMRSGSLPGPVTLKQGETRDLGDVRAKPNPIN
jgi:RNA polymerase sigma factor (sigma-70 family)